MLTHFGGAVVEKGAAGVDGRTRERGELLDDTVAAGKADLRQWID